MTRHSYVDATTGRFIKWFDGHVDTNGAPPQFDDIFLWLRDGEDYRNPLSAMAMLCVGLREKKESRLLQWIATVLINELEDERKFGDTAERFFNALVRRCGVDDTEVNMYDKHKRVGTLHDLQLHKEDIDARTGSV
jgi:hypothetical protein